MRLFYTLLMSSVLVMGFAADVWARGCYSQAEAEAEQGIKIHSELMVIGLNCQHMTPSGWKNFYMQYREFSNRHADLFAGYEKTLINYRKKSGQGGAERWLHSMRTDFANKVSSDVAAMRPDVFCATYAPRIPKVAVMSRAELQSWVSSAATSQRLSQPVCH